MTNFSVICLAPPRGRFSPRTLETLLEQTSAPAEVIFAGFSPAAHEQEKLHSRSVPFLYLPGQPVKPGKLLNEAIKLSKGDWLAFLASGTIWSSEFLEECHQACGNFPDCNTLVASGADSRKIYASGTGLRPGPQISLLSGHLLWHKDLLLSYGLFDERLTYYWYYELFLRMSRGIRYRNVKHALVRFSDASPDHYLSLKRTFEHARVMLAHRDQSGAHRLLKKLLKKTTAQEE